MGRTYADPDVSEDTKERIRSELSAGGPREPWDLVDDLVEAGLSEDSVRKGLRVMTFDGEVITTLGGEVELREGDS